MTFEFEKNFNEQDLINCADNFYNSMNDSALFENIMYKWNYNDLIMAVGRMREHLPVLVTKKDIEFLKEKLGPENILKYFSDWKRTLTESMDPFISKQFVSDPFNLNEIFLNKIISINSMQNSITIYNGRFFTNDLKKIIIIAVPVISSTDSGNADILINFIEEQKQLLSEEFPGLKVSYLSGHRFSKENAQRMQGDIQLTLTLAVTGIILLSIFIYRRPSLVLLTLFPAVFGSVFSLGILRWIMPDISAIIIGCGAMFVGISVDYSIHILFHIDRIKSNDNFRENIISILKNVSAPLLLSAGTTMTAFITLNLSVLPGYQQLGLFVFFGIIGALLFVLIVLPLFIPSPGKKLKKKPLLNIDLFLNMVFSFSEKYKMLFIIIIIILSCLMIPGFLNISFDGDITRLNVSTEEIDSDMNNVLDSLGNTADYILIASRGENLEAALSESEKLNLHLEKLRNISLVETYNSISEIIPSLKKQESNKENWNIFLKSSFINNLENSLKNAAYSLDIKYSFLNDAYNSLFNDTESVSRNSYTNTLVNTIISNQIGTSRNTAMVLTPVSLKNNNYFNILKKYFKLTGLNLVVYSGKSFSNAVLSLIFSEMQKIILIAAVCIILLLFLIKRNIITVIKMLIPLFLSLFWTFSIMGWFDIKINIINCLIAVFIFGLVIDYCIFLVYASENANGSGYILNTGSAVSVSAVTTIIGLGALILARHPALSSIGFTALIAISSGLVCVLMLIPVLFNKSLKT
jgi:uncharacterized protein